MKKVLLFLGMAILGVAAQAQDFKPVKGDVTTEFGLSGGINTTDFNLNEGAGLLRFRYFKSDNVAYRLGFNIGSSNVTNNAYGIAGSEEGQKGSATATSTDFLVNLGIEKHFTGTERLSPYVGADILFGTGTSKTSFESATGTTNSPVYTNGAFSEVKGPGYVSLGLRGVIGADYYIAKRLYLGVEAGFGFEYAAAGKTKTTVTVPEGTTTSTTTKSAGKSFELSPSVITGVRVGFAF